MEIIRSIFRSFVSISWNMPKSDHLSSCIITPLYLIVVATRYLIVVGVG